MRLVPAAGLHHAKRACYLCLRNGQMVDTGMQIEGEGVLAICVRCFLDGGMQVGLLTMEQSYQFRQRVHELEVALSAANDEIIAKERQLDELTTQLAWERRGQPAPQQQAAAL